MINIVPALLPQNFADLEEAVARVAAFVPRVQVDIVDGIFAPSRTWPFQGDRGEFKALTGEERGLPHWEDMEYEIDMMVVKPEEKMDAWIAAGASALIIHRESVTDDELEAILGKAESRIDIGLAFRPSTPLESLEAWIPRIAFLQCMGSDTIGKHGVPLDDHVIAIVRVLRARHQDLTIAVDIGVNAETAPLLVEAGADKLAIGSALMSAPDVREEIEWFKSLG